MKDIITFIDITTPPESFNYIAFIFLNHISGKMFKQRLPIQPNVTSAKLLYLDLF